MCQWCLRWLDTFGDRMFRNRTSEPAQRRPGLWPSAIRRFAYDMLPAKIAPEDDGATSPEFQAPDWISEIANVPQALDIARKAREGEEEGARIAEEKAARLSQILLALLTITLALGSFQLSYVLDDPSGRWEWLLPVGLAIVFLSVSLFESIQIDRVGFYSQPSLEDLVTSNGETPHERILLREERGRFLAKWTSNKKHSDLMQARAWFTRGLVALLVAGMVAGVTKAGEEAKPTNRSVPTHSSPASAKGNRNHSAPVKTSVSG